MEARTGKLVFKGEPKKKKKKRPVSDDNPQKQAAPAQEPSSDPPAWVLTNDPVHFIGPIFIVSMATNPPSVLSAHEASTKIHLKPLPTTQQQTPAKKKKIHYDEDEEDFIQPDYAVLLQQVEPKDVATVLVGKRATFEDTSISISNQPPKSKIPKISISSAYDKFLTCDKFGCATFERDAVGPSEEFEVIVKEDGVAFRNMFGTFLRAEDGGGVRFDSETVGSRETFRVKVQSGNIVKKKTKVEEEAELNLKQLERDQIKRFHAGHNGSWQFVTHSKLSLSEAIQNGNINETMLDRREKIKSDKFCK
ncbi:Protein frg1 [Nowakowskiella sp. JEL0407]|nr:Protein frg1 [Nowakowskiella sp. JEL0407]